MRSYSDITLKYLKKNNIQIPEQVSIMCYGNIENSELFFVKPAYATLNPQVIAAKAYLASGEAPNATQAAKMAGISRSAYYKYKDGDIENNPQNSGEMLTLSLKL